MGTAPQPKRLFLIDFVRGSGAAQCEGRKGGRDIDAQGALNPCLAINDTLRCSPLRSAAVDVDSLTPLGKDTLMHYVDFAMGGFGSTPSSAATRRALRAIVEEAFWGSPRRGPCRCLSNAPPQEQQHDDKEESEGVTTPKVLLEVLTVEDTACAAVFEEGRSHSTLAWLLPLLPTVSRTLWMLAHDAQSAATKALAADQVQTAFLVSSRHISVAALQQTNHRHLFVLSLSNRRHGSTPETVLCNAVIEPQATAQLLATDAATSGVERLLGSPRSAEAVLRGAILSCGRQKVWGGRGVFSAALLPLLCAPVASLVAGLRLTSEWSDTADLPTMESCLADGQFYRGCPLVSLVLDYVVPSADPVGGDGRGDVSWNALVTALRDAYELLKRREDILMARGDSTMFLSMDDEQDMDVAVAMQGLHGNVESSGLWFTGVFDSRAALSLLKGQSPFCLTRPGSVAHSTGVSSQGRSEEGPNLFAERELAVPLIPSSGVDTGGHLTGILRACDVLCAALGVDPSCGAPRTRPEHRFSLLPDTDSRSFTDDVIALRHLARVSIARRYMTRPPRALWRSPPLSSSSPPLVEDDAIADLERLRAFPYCAELTRSLRAIDMPKHRLVLLYVCKPSSTAVARSAFCGCTRSFLLSLSYLLPEWTPQLLVCPAFDDPADLASPAVGGPGAFTSGSRERKMVGVRCWPVRFPGYGGDHRCSNTPSSDWARVVELLLTADHVEFIRQHVRNASCDANTGPPPLALCCHGSECLSLCPLEALGLGSLLP